MWFSIDKDISSTVQRIQDKSLAKDKVTEDAFESLINPKYRSYFEYDSTTKTNDLLFR